MKATKGIRQERRALARECAKLDPKVEQRLAEEGMAIELDQWPDYRERPRTGPTARQ